MKITRHLDRTITVHTGLRDFRLPVDVIASIVDASIPLRELKEDELQWLSVEAIPERFFGDHGDWAVRKDGRIFRIETAYYWSPSKEAKIEESEDPSMVGANLYGAKFEAIAPLSQWQRMPILISEVDGLIDILGV